MNENIAYFCGLWIAEGSFDDSIGRVTITCGDDSVGGVLESGAVFGVKFKKNRSDQWRANSYELLEAMRYLKMPLVKAPEKWLPDWVWSGKREWACQVLSGLIDGDGYISSKRNKIGFTSASERLARDVQLLLTNLGVMSRLTAVVGKPTRRVRVSSTQYRVEMFGENVSRLKSILSLRIKRKRLLLEAMDDNLFSRRDGVPNVLPHLMSIKAVFKGVKMHKLDKTVETAGRGSDITARSLVEVLKECEFAEATEGWQAIKRILNEGYYWDEVTSVEEGECSTYDFTIPDTQSFWSDGFISHNTPKAYNGLYKLWEIGQKGTSKAWASWQFPTITSPFIPGSEVEAARSDMDEKSFKQEFEACHLPDTLIQLWGGKKKPIRDIQPGVDMVVHLGPDGVQYPCPVLKVGVTGVKQVVDVTIETGEVISASNHHKFKVHDHG